MKIEDLIQLLNNRLREFKLSRDYAKMSGDLERMNSADKEIIALGDTLYQLNLLADTSKSAAVKETSLTEVMTEGSVSVLDEYDITSYATDPLHEEKVMTILSKMGVMDTVEKIDDYIKGKYPSSPVTGEMIMSAAIAYSVDTRLMMAIMEQDSRFGTVGLAVSTLNPGNVGNDDAGNIRTYESWQEGVTAVAEWLNRHRISAEATGEIIVDPITTATSTPSTTISTSTPATSTSSGQATSTPSTATTTPVTNTSTTATSTTQTIPITTTSTTTPSTATSTVETVPETTSTTTPITASTGTSLEAVATTTIPVMDTSTTSPATVVSTEEIAPTTEEVVSTGSAQTATTTAH